jgi:hypothetical protein
LGACCAGGATNRNCGFFLSRARCRRRRDRACRRACNGFIDAYKAKLDAANSHDRIAADLAGQAIAAEIEARKSADAVIIAEQGRWYTAVIRPLLAIPVIIFMWKVIVWDKVLGLGTTDALAGDVAQWSGAVVTTYVGGRSLEKIARTIWGRT